MGYNSIILDVFTVIFLRIGFFHGDEHHHQMCQTTIWEKTLFGWLFPSIEESQIQDKGVMEVCWCLDVCFLLGRELVAECKKKDEEIWRNWTRVYSYRVITWFNIQTVNLISTQMSVVPPKKHQWRLWLIEDSIKGGVYISKWGRNPLNNTTNIYLQGLIQVVVSQRCFFLNHKFLGIFSATRRPVPRQPFCGEARS